MKLSEIKTPVSSVTGVGPKIANCLAKLNCFTVADLLQYFPKKFEDRTKKRFLNEFQTGKIHTVAKVVSHQWFGYGNMKTLKITINDETGIAQLICFNRSFLERQLPPGTIITVTGHFYEKYNEVQSTDFEVEVMPEANPNNLQEIQPLNSKIIPLYALTEGLSQKQLSKAIQSALAQYGFGLEDELPQDLIEKNGLLHKTQAIHLIHNAKTLEEHMQARRTLVYEELYHFMYVIQKRASLRRGLSSNQIQNEDAAFDRQAFIASLSPLQQKLYNKLPFELTEDQCRVIEQMNSEIDKGFAERNRIVVQYERGIPLQLRPPFTMSRLLQGDVGSGKTLCALMVCLRIINWKGQCALMAPTEILARQHAETAHKLLEDLGIRTAFLTGNIKAAGRNLLLKALKEGEIDIVIGTHALFSNQVQYNDLQLAIIDEQHRFGVMQRQAIVAKGRINEKCGLAFEPHLLMMSATPIPQSLALTLYGDLDVSTIKNRPSGRKEIKTYLVKEGNEVNAYEAVRKELAAGHQAYFVYPAIGGDLEEENGNGTKYKTAEQSFELLANRVFPEYKCALLHSKIDDEQQVQILHDFQNGKIQVLAATTVIEVGVDVPNATSMVIEMADHFGMAQLHQLRGRVGRGKDQSYCYLIYSNNITKTGIERMKALRESTDGFYIAEQDLKTRGPGELNGTMQAGALEFTIADLSRDMSILTQVKQDILTHLA